MRVPSNWTHVRRSPATATRWPFTTRGSSLSWKDLVADLIRFLALDLRSAGVPGETAKFSKMSQIERMTWYAVNDVPSTATFSTSLAITVTRFPSMSPGIAVYMPESSA